MEKKRIRIGLIPKLIIGITFGLLLGSFVPEWCVRIFVTLASIFAAYLNFVIPLMIVSFVATGIAHLPGVGAGKLLGFTVTFAYISTIVAGTSAYAVDSLIFPKFITSDIIKQFSETSGVTVDSYLEFELPPAFSVTTAIVLAFIFGIGIIAMKNARGLSHVASAMTDLFDGFQYIINLVLAKTIIPVLPFYIGFTFAKFSYTGEVWSVLKVFWKVYVVVILLHLTYLTIMFVVAGSVSKTNPLRYIKNQVAGYLTAVGTQSSAATIPVNVVCAEKNGVSKSIREFVVPLCATIHLAGSTITIVSCATAILFMTNMAHNMAIMIPFILTLGIVMIAAPGAPGGAVMSALSFLPMIGIPVEGQLASLMIALYLTQDSFGTACNISGDNAIAVIIDTFKDRIMGTKTV